MAGRPGPGGLPAIRPPGQGQGGFGLRGSIDQHHFLTLPPRKLGHLPAHLGPNLMLPPAGAGEGLRHPPLLRPLRQPDQTNGLRPPRTIQRLADGGDPDRPCRVNRAEGDKACRTRPPAPSNSCQHHRCDHDHPGRSRPGGPTPARTSPLTWPLPNTARQPFRTLGRTIQPAAPAGVACAKHGPAVRLRARPGACGHRRPSRAGHLRVRPTRQDPAPARGRRRSRSGRRGAR